MINMEKEELASRLRGSFIEFCKFFFLRLRQSELIISNPPGRESHHITLARELTLLHRTENEYYGLIINMPPGYGKTLFVSMWVAWCYTHNARCNFLYVSYSHELATKATTFIKEIMSDKIYSYLFDINISRETRAKDNFYTELGGGVVALGSAGTITGQNAGLPNDEFSGALIIDDPIKPNEASSETIRQKVIDNYVGTLAQRPRGKRVPIVFIGQRVHEDDLAQFLLDGKDIRNWKHVNLTALDKNDMALYPEKDTREKLIELRKKAPYVFFSQYQQQPIPAGNGLFNRSWIYQMDEEPDMLFTFITADTAETEKEYNDFTVFSFWGIYKLKVNGTQTGKLGLHWIDCHAIHVEPKHLKSEFDDFFVGCCRYKTKPTKVAIEKKSTGVTLVSQLEDMRGIEIIKINRTKESGSKSDRFISIQSFVSDKNVSINSEAKHKETVLSHIEKITANNTHKNDDIADTLYDAIKIVYIDKRFEHNYNNIDNDVPSRIMGNQRILINNTQGIGHVNY